ncbi:MAG: ribulose-phosphate 3-epimerase [Planctomycetota bacterium]
MTTPRARLHDLRRKAPTILPSLLLCDFGNLQSEVDQLTAAGVQGLHLDVMDGRFVPNLTYGMPIVAAFRRLTDMPLDVHLMIAHPEQYIDAFCDAGADGLTVHVETTEDLAGVLAKIRSRDVAAGVALNPDTPLEALAPAVGNCDLVLVMSVNAGFGGQAFDPRSLDKMRAVREQFGDEVILEVDGGVNAHTIAECGAAGAEFLVVGSAIFKADDYAAAMDSLNSRLAGG